MAEPYLNEIDFAFFVVNFNYTKRDFDELTPKEKAFIRKAWEDKILLDTQLINKAVINAIVNTNRKKGKRYIDLWEESKEISEEQKEDYRKMIKEIESNKDKSWVDKIYKANGRSQ